MGCCASEPKQRYEVSKDVHLPTREIHGKSWKKSVSLDTVLEPANTDSGKVKNLGGSTDSNKSTDSGVDVLEPANTDSGKVKNLGGSTDSNKSTDSGVDVLEPANTDSGKVKNLGGSTDSNKSTDSGVDVLEPANTDSGKVKNLGGSTDSNKSTDSGVDGNTDSGKVKNLGGSTDSNKSTYSGVDGNTDSGKVKNLGGSTDSNKSTYSGVDGNTDSGKVKNLGGSTDSNKSTYSGVDVLEPANTDSGKVKILGGSTDSKDSGVDGNPEYLEWLSVEDKTKIHRNYRYLLKNLMTMSVTRILVAENVLSEEDEHEIKGKESERAKAELFIQKLLHTKPESYKVFLKALLDSKQEFIVDKIESPSRKQLAELPVVTSEFVNERIERTLKDKTAYIVKELHPKNIMGYFVEQEIIKIEDLERIGFKPREVQARFLLDYILSNLPYAYYILLHSLKKTGSKPLAHRLHTWVSETRNDTTDEKWHRIQRNGNHYSNTDASISDIEFRIKICQTENEHDLMECLRDQLNADNQHEVGKQLLQKAECVFKKASLGSLILYLTPCSRVSYAKLLEFCKDGHVENLLKTMLSTDKVKQFLPKGPVSIKIQLRARDMLEESKTNEASCLRSRLIELFETVVDEIDPIDFKDSFIKQDLLSEEYFHQLGLDLGHSRSARATDLLTKVLQLGDNAILAFKETVVKKGPEYLLEVLYRDSKTVHDNHDHDACIAELELLKDKSMDSDGFVFYDRDFCLTIQERIDYSNLQDIKALDGVQCMRKLETKEQMNTVSKVDHSSLRKNRTSFSESPLSSPRNSSGYGSLCSSISSNDK